MPTSIFSSPLRGFHRRLVSLALLSPFADGYLISVLGVGMMPITEQLQLTPSGQGLLGSAALVGVFIGSLLGGWAADHFGRRVIFRIDLSLLAAASIAMLWVQDPIWLIALRLLAGVSTGASYPVAALMITETIPPRYRGTMISMVTICWFGGAMVAYLLGDWLVRVGLEGWRIAFAFAAIPAFIAIIGRRNAPESIMWLVRQGRSKEASALVRSCYGPEYDLEGLESGTREQAGLGAIIRSGYLGKLVFVALFWSCSLIPLNIVYAFGPILIRGIGLPETVASGAALIINVLLFLGCVLWALIMNTTRHRRVVIWSFSSSGLALALLGLFPEAPSWVIISCFGGFALAVCGSQILQPLYPNEIFPTAIRGSGMGLASATARIFAVLGLFLAPQLLASGGVGATLIAAAAVSALGALICVIWAPETLRRHR